MSVPVAYLDVPIQPDDIAAEIVKGFVPKSDLFIVTELPDLSPRSNYQAWLKHRGWKESRWVNILLQARPDEHIGPSDSNLRIFGRTWFPDAKIIDKGQEFGLQWLSVDRTARDIFVRYENDTRVTLIVCSQIGSVPAPSCQQFLRIRPGLQAEIIYGRQYLPQWLEFEMKTHGLINRFICDAEDLYESKKGRTICPD